jgi:23S rRNA maturation mini-RNase III
MQGQFEIIEPMPTRVTLKAINSELTKRGRNARLEKGSGYFYFMGGEATGWIDRTVQAATVGALTLEQWMNEFDRLKKLNAEIMKGKPTPKRT